MTLWLGELHRNSSVLLLLSGLKAMELCDWHKDQMLLFLNFLLSFKPNCSHIKKWIFLKLYCKHSTYTYYSSESNTLTREHTLPLCIFLKGEGLLTTTKKDSILAAGHSSFVEKHSIVFHKCLVFFPLESFRTWFPTLPWKELLSAL